MVWALAQSRGDGHRSLVTPERVLSEYNVLREYNKDLIFFDYHENKFFSVSYWFYSVKKQVAKLQDLFSFQNMLETKFFKALFLHQHYAFIFFSFLNK